MRRALEPGAPPFLPLVPGREHPYGYLPDSREGNYYAILAPRMLEAELFPRDDELALVVSEFLEARGGLVRCPPFRAISPPAGGRPERTTRSSASTPTSYGYAGLTNLRHDRIARFLLTYRGLMAYGMSKGTFAPPEWLITTARDPMPVGKRFEWCALPQPHLHSLAQLLRVVRMLWCRRKATRCGWPGPRRGNGWREGRCSGSAARPPLGRVSFTIGSADAAGRVVATIAVEWHHPAYASCACGIRSAAHRGGGRGRRARRYDDETIALHDLSGSARVVATLA